MLGKISRIFFKSVGLLFVALIILCFALYFAIQSFAFQTWLAQRVSAYLSGQMNTEIKIDKIAIRFFKNAELKGLMIKDQKGDTLFAGDLGLAIHTFDYKKKKIYFNDIRILNAVSRIKLAKNDSNYNYQFIADYFKSDNNSDTAPSNWNIRIKKITLQNVCFAYKNLNDTVKLPNNINYNNLELSAVNGQILYPIIAKDKFIFEIKNLSLKEKSGFHLKELTAGIHLSSRQLQAEHLRLETDKTLIKANLYFNYGHWQDYTDFINKIHIVSKFEDSTKLNFGDIAYFAPALNKFNEELQFSGHISGTVSDFNLKKFKLKYRDYTQFKGNLSLTGLPDLSNSFLHFEAKVLSTNYKDLVQFPIMNGEQTTYLNLPPSIQKLGTTSYKGKFDGLLNDFTTYGIFTSELGLIDSKLSIQLGDKNKNIHYQGKISTEYFDLGKLLGLNDFNAISMNMELKGEGLDLNSINSEAKGHIDNIQIQGYNYSKIKLNGSLNEKVFNGYFSCLDTNANFDFNGSVNFKRQVPEMYFISSINRLNLNKLHLTSLLDSGEFSSQLFINISGDNIDKLSGQINFDNSVYKTKTKTYKLNRFNLDLNQTADTKSITLKSAYFNANIAGQYKLGDFGIAAQNILAQYYPSYFKIEKLNKIMSDQFTFDINIKDFQTIHDLLLPDLMLSKGSRISGNFNALNQKLNLDFTSTLLSFKLFDIRQLNLKLNQIDKAVVCDVNAESVKVGDSVGVEQLMVNLKSLDQFLSYQLNWDNHHVPLSNGLLKGRIIFDKLQTALYNDSLRICINDSVWKQENLSALSFGKNGLAIQKLEVSHNNQSIGVNGEFSIHENDSLQFKVNHINLAQFNPILKLFHAKVEGEMNGYLYLSQPNNHFAIDGNVNLQRLKMNDNLVGELSLSSTYNTKNKYLNLHGFTSLGLQDEFGNQIKNIAFNGNYFLDNRPDCIDIDLIANPANIKLLNPILTDILTIKNGYLSGKLKIHGSPENLLLDGKLRLFNTELKVDYTNVVYNVSGDIEVMPDQIRFSDILLREKGTKAAAQGTVNGNIFHTKFKKVQLDYDINYKNMLVLNTTEKENSFYYGRIYSSGRAGIYGYLNNLSMQIFDTTTKNSRFVMQLDGPNEIEDDDFVHFVKKDTNKVKKELDFTGFNLDLSISATPNASVQIILDKQNGDMLNAQGQGNINLKINTLGKFEMTGDYLITNGDYLFTLEHVINKKFDIEAGSSISWNGDPLNADINVATSYKQRASVAALLNDTTGVYKSRYAVDCKLLLSGKLFSPMINFAFDFPNIDATAKARINNVLSDEGELNRQVFSFLLFRSFVTPQVFNANGGGVTAAAASTSSELLSNRISGFLNSYFGGLPGLRDLQLGLNYRPGSQNTKESVDLALSKQFLNNKMSVDGNFGMNNTQAGNSGNFIGDVTIDYKLTDDGRYKLTGFNRTNTSAQITTAGGPYTQGFGFFYRREFNSLRDFMNRNKMK